MKKKIASISALIALALLLWIIETAISLPLPIKLGMGNIATVVALYVFGLREAIWVSLGRVVIGSLIIGKLFSITMLLGLSGAFASLLVMGLLYKNISPVGLSIAGAWFHIVGQFLLAYFLLYQQANLFFFFPLFAIIGLSGGLITGFISRRIILAVKPSIT